MALYAPFVTTRTSQSQAEFLVMLDIIVFLDVEMVGPRSLVLNCVMS